MINKIINLTILILSLILLVYTPRWETILFFIIIVWIYFDLEFKEHKKHKDLESFKHDNKLFYSFLNDLSSNDESIKFIRNFDFKNSFPKEQLNKLYELDKEWNKMDFNFENEELEIAKKDFLHRNRKFLKMIEKKTTPGHLNWLSAIPKKFRKSFYLPTEVLKEIDSLNDAAINVYKSYENLLDIGSEKLNKKVY